MEENAKMKTELAEARQVQDTLKQREKDNEVKMASVSKQLEHYTKQVGRRGLTARIVAVNSGWNFVVLDVGDRAGSVVNAPLIVSRGGQQIAQLRVTSVEPNTSIADVVPGTMRRGQAVQPGDLVIFAHQKDEPAPADTGAPAPDSSAQVR